MLVDAYCHIHPRRFFDELFGRSEKLATRWCWETGLVRKLHC
jgi:hypothetical protein